MRATAGLVAIAAVLLTAQAAAARGARVAFDGGTPAQRAQVAAALKASSFDWSLLPAVTVHIARGVDSHALPGEVWLDADLLDAGSFAWGVVQEEFAHEVDFLVLTDAQRTVLQQALGGTTWFGGAAHAELGCERFASTLAWSFWQSPSNVMRPQSATDESAAMAPARFRALLAQLLPAS
jgi:sugar/nucleoside kinase (ribokinase family)